MIKSIAFPSMVSNTSTKIFSEHEATASNLRLLLFSDKGGLFGDPYFGTNIKKLMFEQNDTVLRDIVIDDIYSAILQFMPQVLVKRRDIDIIQSGSSVFINIRATNMTSYTTDLYQIDLLSYEVR